MSAVGGPRIAESRYFLAVAVGVAALVFAGFLRSYYLRGMFGSPPLSTLLHVHGAVMTAWVALLAIQVALIVVHRPLWHRRLGVAGVASAALVVGLGSFMTLHAAAREVAAHSKQAPVQLTILGLELMQMLLFTGLFAMAFYLRRRVDHHKRLMVLATACLLPSPIARLPGIEANLQILLIFDAIVLAAVVVDTWRNRRLHPAFGWGALLLLGGIQLAYTISYTTRWRDFGAWLVS